MIDGDCFSGTRAQLARVLESLATYTAGWVWYASDLDGNGPLPKDLFLSRSAVRIGALSAVRRVIEPIDRFIWGIFLAYPREGLAPDHAEKVIAEDEATVASVIGSEGIGVRVFDGSHIDVLSANLEPLQTLVERFGGRIEPIKSHQ